MDEVLGNEMEPVHRAPFDVVGVILGKEVVLALEIAKTIRVIHPPFGRRNVKYGSNFVHFGNVPKYIISQCKRFTNQTGICHLPISNLRRFHRLFDINY